MFKRLVSQANSLLLASANETTVLGSMLRSSAKMMLVSPDNYHTSSIMRQGQGKNEKSAADEDVPEFQTDLSSGLKNLERVGLAKYSWSWPQYNRIVYPPTEDGKPIKTPVSDLTCPPCSVYSIWL